VAFRVLCPNDFTWLTRPHERAAVLETALQS
jgi:hypothetical protein